MESNKTCNCGEEFEVCNCEDESSQQADEMESNKNDSKCICDECICEVDPDLDFESNGDLIY